MIAVSDNGLIETALQGTEGGENVSPPQNETENSKTDDNTETDGNSNFAVNTCIHTVFLNKTVENSRIFKHTDEKSGEVVEMGESEIQRRLRVYTTRVLETEAKIKELEEKGDLDMIEKQNTVLENRKQAKAYWETALNQVTEETATVLQKAA